MYITCSSVLISFLCFCISSFLLRTVFSRPALFHSLSIKQLTFLMILMFCQMFLPLVWEFRSLQFLDCVLDSVLSRSLYDFLNGYAILSWIYAAGMLLSLRSWRIRENLARQCMETAVRTGHRLHIRDYVPDYRGPDYPVYACSLFRSPIVIAQGKYILMPETAYTDPEMFYILQHESCHLLNGDGMYLQVFNMLKIVFWFLPVARVARSVLVLFTECRVDRMVTAPLPANEILVYCESLIHVARQKTSLAAAAAVSAMGFALKDEDILQYRVILLLESTSASMPSGWKKNCCFACCLAVMGLGLLL